MLITYVDKNGNEQTASLKNFIPVKDTSIKKPGTISQGIENMKSRCLNASGIFAIQSDIEEGTKIHLEFPNDELFKRTLESIQPNSDSFNEFEIDINKHEIT